MTELMTLRFKSRLAHIDVWVNHYRHTRFASFSDGKLPYNSSGRVQCEWPERQRGHFANRIMVIRSKGQLKRNRSNGTLFSNERGDISEAG